MKDELFFLDTNVIVYSFDNSSPKKKLIAQNLIEDALRSGRGFISTQVAQEFINVSKRKFLKPLSLSEQTAYLYQVLTPLCTIFTDLALISRAMAISEQYRFNFYDSLIISGGLASGAKILLSEDLQDGFQIENLRIVNPFLANWD